MNAPRHSPRWWSLVLLHNWVAHPVLPLGEVLDVLPSRRARRVAKAIFDLHDATFPAGGG